MATDPAQSAEPSRINQNVARGAATRDHLVAVATSLFAERGYEGTSIDAVLEAAGVSRGSLYHHFKGKDALFEAVLEAVELDIGRRTVAVADETATTATGLLRVGCREWVRLAGDPVIQRILLIDAPAVLGWEQWRALDERHALGVIKEVMAAIAAEGGVDRELVDVFAHIVMATMNEISLYVAQAADPEAARSAGLAAVEEFLDRLFPEPPE